VSGAHSEAAFFLSADAGASWRRLGGPVPSAPVRDLSFSRDAEAIGVATTDDGDFAVHP
jgi:hypothetical protein